MKTSEELLKDLSGFTGTEKYYRHSLMPGFMYTDGVRYVADKAEAYWLLDVVFSHQLIPSVRKQPFQVWTLTVKNSKAMVTATDGNDRVISKQEISFTDFPLSEITFYFTDNVLMLPSEY